MIYLTRTRFIPTGFATNPPPNLFHGKPYMQKLYATAAPAWCDTLSSTHQQFDRAHQCTTMRYYDLSYADDIVDPDLLCDNPAAEPFSWNAVHDTIRDPPWRKTTHSRLSRCRGNSPSWLLGVCGDSSSRFLRDERRAFLRRVCPGRNVYHVNSADLLQTSLYSSVYALRVDPVVRERKIKAGKLRRARVGRRNARARKVKYSRIALLDYTYFILALLYFMNTNYNLMQPGRWLLTASNIAWRMCIAGLKMKTSHSAQYVE